jgi:hypothetical protein
VIGMKGTAATLALFSVSMLPLARHAQDDRAWTSDFEYERAQLVSSGTNPWFSLEPGYTLRLADATDTLIITVLPTKRIVDKIETRIVEERESSHGKLVEVSRNFYAISKRTNSVYYFGEEVDMYKDGKVTSHEGSWLAGVGGARFGLMMPGVPLLGGKHYQEIAPGKAMDRAEIVSLTENVTTPAGTFRNVLKTLESSPLEKGTEPKLYGREVGLLQEGTLKLVKYGKDERR